MEDEKTPVVDTSTPMVVFINGVGFKSFTDEFEKPFDEILIKTMQDTMYYLCDNIKGCVFGYTWSDKIILMIYEPVHVWTERDSQKRCSAATSMATMAFNASFAENVDTLYEELNSKVSHFDAFYSPYIIGMHDHSISKHFIYKKAMFSSYITRLPKDKANEYFRLWQEKAMKESAEATSPLVTDWDKLPPYLKYGSCCIKKQEKSWLKELLIFDENIPSFKERWIIDENVPLFSENTDYINNIIRMMK